MLPKNNRLPRDAFHRVLKTGKRIHGEDTSLIVSPNTLTISRFAVQAGTKIEKKAIGRNRMKRLIREALRHLLPTMKPGYDCIVIAQKNFSEKKEQEVEISLTNLFQKYSFTRK